MDEIERQHAQLNKLIVSLDVASDEGFDAILAEGEFDENSTGLDPELVARIEAKIANNRQPKAG